jgi:beta-xylosidase
VIKHPTNGQYYLLYACGAIGTCIGRSASPLGPWVNATAGTTTASAPLYRQGEMFGANDWFDAQFFVDGDRVYMTFGGGGGVGVAALAFAEDLSVTIDDTDPRMTDGTLHEFKRLTGLTNYLEGSVMFKSGAQYFVTYSNSACQNYNVQYAVGSSPVGPFTHAEGTILQRDDAKNVLGPGTIRSCNTAMIGTSSTIGSTIRMSMSKDRPPSTVSGSTAPRSPRACRRKKGSLRVTARSRRW